MDTPELLGRLDKAERRPESEGAMAVFTDDTAVPMLTGSASRARDAGALSPRQTEKWVVEQRARAVSGRLFLAIPYLIVSADRT